MRYFEIHFCRIYLLSALLYFNAGKLFSQHVSRDNYTGAWETPASWDPQWITPLKVILVDDITIYGYITISSSLSFSGGSSSLIVNDTLVIDGNLTLENQSGLMVNDGAVVIIRGNLIIHARSVIKANGYLVITGNVINENPNNFGSFTSNDKPEKVYIGGTISPSDLGTHVNYSALHCTSESGTTYPNSFCNYGNMIDFSQDQLYPLLEASCPVHKASSNGLVCQGDTIRLYADSGTAFRWRGPGTYSSFYQNPIIPDAVPAMSGSYSAIIQSYGCLADTVYTEVVVNNLPSVSITSKGDPMCEDETRQLDGFPPGGIFNVISGPGLISSDLLSVSDTGTIDLLYSYNDVCTALAYQSIRVNSVPSVNAGSSQDLKVVFETHFNAELTQHQTGEWSVVSGNGQIADMNSPVSAVTGLAVGENVFLWTVHEGNCISSAEVTIKVSDLFLPSVITPNGDGKNDLFKVNGPEGKMELVIFSRWGNVEYGNHDYQNTWDGRNNRGAVMPYDTYMYIVKFSNGLTRKGTVLIVR